MSIVEQLAPAFVWFRVKARNCLRPKPNELAQLVVARGVLDEAIYTITQASAGGTQSPAKRKKAVALLSRRRTIDRRIALLTRSPKITRR